MPPRRTSPFIKIAFALIVVAGLGVLFWQTLDDARAEPYTVRAAQLRGWVIASGTSPDPDAPLLALQPPPELSMRLFRQVFARAGESLSTPMTPGIALVLRRELGSTAALSPDVLAALARESGLEGLTLAPRCMAYRRESGPGSVRQLYFVLFDMPEFARFREAVSARVRASGAGFDPAALSPVMPLAAQPDFSQWMPIVADAEADCVAPVTTEGQ